MAKPSSFIQIPMSCRFIFFIFQEEKEEMLATAGEILARPSECYCIRKKKEKKSWKEPFRVEYDENKTHCFACIQYALTFIPSSERAAVRVKEEVKFSFLYGVGVCELNPMCCRIELHPLLLSLFAALPSRLMFGGCACWCPFIHLLYMYIID